ncbi:MAG: xylulokinase [Planctomycetota bacterium]
MSFVVGIDVGTTSARALVCNEAGGILASAAEEYPLYAPKPGWSEQKCEDWWEATVVAVNVAMEQAKVKAEEIKGIGLTGQMHGAVFLDEKNEALRPAILWNDQRTAEECEEITSTVGREKLLAIAANPALTGFTAPKILWVRKHEPEVYEKTRKILLPKDYVRYRMTGEHATEVSDASGTLLLDVGKRAWSGELLSALGIDATLLPAVHESPVVSGRLTVEAAAELRLCPRTPVAGGGGDQAAGGVGNGIVKKGTISATMGTSGVVFAFADTVQTDPKGRAHTFCHAVPGRWHVMGVVLAAGGSFQWLRDNLGALETDQAKRIGCDPYEILCEEAEEAAAGSEGLWWLPYLTGERTPHADANARACWIGITQRHGKNELVRAVMEGATYAMRDSLEIIRELGIAVEEIRLSGGGARSAFWRQMQANIYGQEVCTINASEGPAFGAALIAGVGTGMYGSVEEACEATISVTSRTSVDEKEKAIYEKGYRIYRRLYPALRKEFQEIGRFVAETSGEGGG